MSKLEGGAEEEVECAIDSAASCMAAAMLSFDAPGGSLETMYPPRMLLVASSSWCSGGAMVAMTESREQQKSKQK